MIWSEPSGSSSWAARHHPAHERRGLVRVAEPHEPVEGERRVADPRVAVVPVAHAADRLGQPEGGRGDDRAVLSGGEELQHERGAVHHLAPAAPVGAAGDPAAPEVHGLLERVGHVVGPRAGRRLVRHHHLEDEPRRLVGAERELGHGGAVRDLHRDRRAQPQRQLARAGAADEQDLRVAAPLHRVRGAGVVEARIAAHAEAHLATDRLRATHEVVRDAGVLHRHEVGHLGHAVVGQEPGEQHVGVGQVELLVRRVVELRRDLEAAAALGVEEGGEHRRRVEGRQAEEVDRSVLAHQRDRVEVADDAVVLDGRVTVCHETDAGAGEAIPLKAHLLLSIKDETVVTRTRWCAPPSGPRSTTADRRSLPRQAPPARPVRRRRRRPGNEPTGWRQGRALMSESGLPEFSGRDLAAPSCPRRRR